MSRAREVLSAVVRVVRLVRVALCEVEEGWRAVARESFLLATSLLQIAFSFLVLCLDESYHQKVQHRQNNSIQKRRYWATPRESSLNKLVSESSSLAGVLSECGSSAASSCSESSGRGAPIFYRLPNYPSINTDVMAGRGYGFLDDIQLVVDLLITWLFEAIKLPFNLSGLRNQECHVNQVRHKCTKPTAIGRQQRPKRFQLPKFSVVSSMFSIPCLAGWASVKTAADVIQLSGYPLEVHKVVTIDGYIITMHRIPRPESRKATFFMHGMLDSSICWVAGGMTSSPAFEAYNQGYDVWLGNSRNTPPREHISADVQSGWQYWRFTSNELGERDIESFVNLIDEVKQKELGDLKQHQISSVILQHKTKLSQHQNDLVKNDGPPQGIKTGGSLRSRTIAKSREILKKLRVRASRGRSLGDIELKPAYEKNEREKTPDSGLCEDLSEVPGIEGENVLEEQQPYSLSAVGHSLGCASILIYVVSCLRKGKKHGFDRLILLAPAGYHRRLPPMAFFSYNFLKPVAWFLTRILRLPGFGVQMPSGLLRLLAFKILPDFRRVPALGEIAQRFMDVFTCDKSSWNKAASATHYINRFTPGISLHTGLHMVQWFHTGKFEMYDYGSKWGNLVHYGATRPPDMAEEYKRIDVPVDFMSGEKDGVISHEDVKLHLEDARRAGIKCRYWGFKHSHLDFSMCMKEEVMDALMTCLA